MLISESFQTFLKEAYNQIWGKTKYGFKKAYDEFYDKVDWVMKADDDTYVILENLRFMLSAYNSSEPIWFGCEFDVIVKEGYMSGGAGYVLSKGDWKQQRYILYILYIYYNNIYILY